MEEIFKLLIVGLCMWAFGFWQSWMHFRPKHKKQEINLTEGK